MQNKINNVIHFGSSCSLPTSARNFPFTLRLERCREQFLKLFKQGIPDMGITPKGTIMPIDGIIPFHKLGIDHIVTELAQQIALVYQSPASMRR